MFARHRESLACRCLAAIRFFGATLAVGLLGAAVLDGFATAVAQQPPIGQTSDKGLEDYIKQLADPSFRSRETAVRRLVAVGSAAIEPLEKAVRGGNLEIIDRASFILQDLALLETPDSDTLAWDAIERLKANGPGAATTRAVSSLDLIRRDRVQRARTALASAGIKAGNQIYQQPGLVTSEVLDMIRIDDSWNGDKQVFRWMPWLYSSQLALIEKADVDIELAEAISKIPGIRKIHIRESEINSAAIRKLSAVPRIDTFELHFVDFGAGDDDLFAIASLPLRQELILTGTQFDEEDIEALKTEMEDLKITVRRGGFLGVQPDLLTNVCSIGRVIPGSAAYNAGIMEGDVIVDINGDPIGKFEDLQAAISKLSPDTEAKIKLMRGGRLKELSLSLGRLP